MSLAASLLQLSDEGRAIVLGFLLLAGAAAALLVLLFLLTRRR